MKTSHVFFSILFFCSVAVNAQSTQENPMTSDQVLGFLKIPDIEGESETAKFEGQIEIYGLASLIEQAAGAATGSARRRVKASMSPISLIKKIDAATPYLMQANLQSKYFRDTTISLVKVTSGAQTPYLIITLKNVIIINHVIDASSNRQEIISLGFEKITVKYITGRDEHEISYDVASGT